jgi:hypothetical protein
MTIGGDYDTPQKVAIRARLWDAAVLDLQRHGRGFDELKIIDLPGAKCLYLRHLAKDFGVRRENIVAVEREEAPFLAIHRYLGGRGITRRGLIEDLCESRELEKYFPVDLVNLDFCGQGFVFPDLAKHRPADRDYQRRWDSIMLVMDFNRAKEKDIWFLLLTLFCNRNNPAGKAFLLGQLEEVSALAGVSKNPARWRDDRLIQEVVPKIVAEEAIHRGYVPSAEAFDSYRYVQEGHASQMVSWKFKLELDAKRSLGRSTTREKQRLDAFCHAYFSTAAKELKL